MLPGLQLLVEGLTEVDPLFARWFKQAKSRKQSLQRPLETDLASLREYIERSILRDDQRAPMEDGGFSVWLWNGGSGEGTWNFTSPAVGVRSGFVMSAS